MQELDEAFARYTSAVADGQPIDAGILALREFSLLLFEAQLERLAKLDALITKREAEPAPAIGPTPVVSRYTVPPGGTAPIRCYCGTMNPPVSAPVMGGVSFGCRVCKSEIWIGNTYGGRLAEGCCHV